MTLFPECLGVVTLSNPVLFPHAHLPLCIDEPRHRAMVRDALEGPMMLALAPGIPGAPRNADVARIACAASIVEHRPRHDGRSDVIVRGERVIELVQSVADSPYPMSRIRPLPREGCFAEEPGAKERLEELLDLVDSSCPGTLDSLRTQLLFDPEDDGGMELLHTICMHLPVEREKKLGWLRRPGSLSRWLGVRETLRELAAARVSRQSTIDFYSDLAPDDPRSN